MKKIFLLSAFLFLCVVYTTISGCGNSNNSTSHSEKVRRLMISATFSGRDSFPLPNENTINLAYDYVLPIAATSYENTALEDIKIGSNPISQVAMSTLKKSDVENLYKQSYALLQASSGSNFITAVEIFYGINSNAMVYYFLPVCLQQNPSLPTPYTYTLTPNSMGISDFYVYNASTGSLSNASLAQFQSDTASYAKQIQIVHYYGAQPTFFQMAVTSSNMLADTKYVIFPFQEIFHVFVCNNVDSLNICNAGVPVHVPNEDYYIKHDLMLTPYSPGMSNPMEEDLAHMVPPDYGTLIYPITH